MNDLVVSISSLCKLLNSLIDITITPEFFRLSKLNMLSSDEIKRFWTVLHKLCCFSSHDCQYDADYCIGRYIMSNSRIAVYCIQSNASHKWLLLSLGFLLCLGAVEAAISELLQHSFLKEEIIIQSTKQPLTAPYDENCPRDLIQYTKFLAEQINSNMKGLENCRQEHIKLFNKIHQISRGFQGLPHLSAEDIQLMRSPQLIADFVTRCCHCSQILEAYTKWQKSNHVFWKWMDSIMKEEEALVITKSLSDYELLYLNKTIYELGHDIRAKIKSEDEETSNDDASYLFTTRIHQNSNAEFVCVIQTLDSKINALTKSNFKKRQVLHNKLTGSNKFNNKINNIDIIPIFQYFA